MFEHYLLNKNERATVTPKIQIRPTKQGQNLNAAEQNPQSENLLLIITVNYGFSTERVLSPMNLN